MLYLTQTSKVYLCFNVTALNTLVVVLQLGIMQFSAE